MSKLTAGQISEAKALRADGWNFNRLGETFGVDGKTIRRALDSDYQVMRCQQVREARLLRAAVASERHPNAGRPAATNAGVHADFAARLAEIPPDTRSLTQRICGDPLPGRDALSRRAGQ